MQYIANTTATATATGGQLQIAIANNYQFHWIPIAHCAMRHGPGPRSIC
jgi:hypothetical protein